MQGPGTVITKNFRSSGAGHGGSGGQPSCYGYKTCRMPKGLPYGDMFQPDEFGSGGDGTSGGIGGGKVKIDVTHTLTVGFFFDIKVVWLAPRHLNYFLYLLAKWIHRSK